MIEAQIREVSSYGLQKVKAYYVRPASVEELSHALILAAENGWQVCPMGSRMSFSDVCLISGQLCLDLTGLNRIISFDHEQGILVTEPGVLLPDILKLVLPAGWCLTGLTGSLSNTVAGNIANDVNGKDSWLSGNFGQNIVSVEVMMADGSIVVAGNDQNRELLDAVIGGLGLVGVISKVTLRLFPVASYMLDTNRKVFHNLDALIDAFMGLEEQGYRYAYAWVDPYARDPAKMTSILDMARFASSKEVTASQRRQFLDNFEQKKRIAGLPPTAFWKLFKLMQRPVVWKGVNTIKAAMAGSYKDTRRVSFPEYQYPMVKHLPQWNLKYMPGGFREMQMIFPPDIFSRAFSDVMSICRKFDQPPELCAIRRHQESNAYLSFSSNGFSMTINFGLRADRAARQEGMQQEIMEKIMQHNGKIYLGKYPFISADECRAMYPMYDKFVDIKRSYDPDKRFWSDAAQRLIMY